MVAGSAGHFFTIEKIADCLMKLIWILPVFASALVSCTVEPVDLNYGVDQCYACRMTITDQRFGAELVTNKGKVFKFDAIECMIPEVIKHRTDTYAFIMTTPYDEPGKLVEVGALDFLQSPEIPSPMGRNLSAHKKSFQTQSPEAKWFKWTNLVESFRK
jgi:copper chaperone NosL